jgi:hypothetical protein
MLLIGSTVDSPSTARDVDVIIRPRDTGKFIREVVEPLCPNGFESRQIKNHLVIRDKIDVVFDLELAYEGSTGYKILRFAEDYPVELNQQYKIPQASPAIMIALRESHKYRNYDGFHGNMQKLQQWKKKYGTKNLREYIPSELRNILEEREQETYAAVKTVSLNVTKEEFFSGDGVNYIYDHDSVHEAVSAYFDRAPIYNKILIDEVKCSQVLWDRLWHEDKINAVIEEAFVLAFERGWVPFPGKRDMEHGNYWFRCALRGICTTTCSGWFREFAHQNYFDILE